MQNQMMNTMQFRKDHAMKGCKVIGILVPMCSQNHAKGQKIVTFQAFVKKVNYFACFND